MLYGVTASEGRTGAATGPPNLYVASAVHFAGAIQSNGPTWLERASLTCGTDNGLFAFSIWAKHWENALNVNGLIFVTDPASIYAPMMQLGGGNDIIYNTYFSGGQYLNAQYNTVVGTGWHHILGSFDSNKAAGAKIAALYVDDILRTGNGSYADAGAAFITASNAKKFVFADDGTGSSGIDCDFADVWIAPNVSLHVGTAIPVANRRLFIDALGKPMDPAGFPTGAILFKGNMSTFATNTGTGGAFTLHGSLTNASSSP
jgi:hypothetical protein